MRLFELGLEVRHVSMSEAVAPRFAEAYLVDDARVVERVTFSLEVFVSRLNVR